VGVIDDADLPADILDRASVQACFRVPEPIFDYGVLKTNVGTRLFESTTERRLGVACCTLEGRPGGGYRATLSDGGTLDVDAVINATYDQINVVNGMLGIPPRELQFEHVVIPMFRHAGPPFGLTVMDGPFCSVMPRGKRQAEFLLYHVRQSVLHRELGRALERPMGRVAEPDLRAIYDDSSLYMPFLRKVEAFGHYEAIRAVHRNDDDARLSQVFTYEGVPNYFAILSGKITTCVQVAVEIKRALDQ
jgi:hypothetical protein